MFTIYRLDTKEYAHTIVEKDDAPPIVTWRPYPEVEGYIDEFEDAVSLAQDIVKFILQREGITVRLQVFEIAADGSPKMERILFDTGDGRLSRGIN